MVERAAPATRKRSPIWCQVSDTLLGVARRILRDPTLAEDVLQNALVTIWRKLPHLREADRFEGWAFRILVHACYAEAPRNRRWASAIRVLHADVASDVDDIQMITDRDELEQAFRRLPARPARRLRPASPRGPAPRGGGRDARHPGRDGAITAALRNPDASRRL